MLKKPQTVPAKPNSWVAGAKVSSAARQKIFYLRLRVSRIIAERPDRGTHRALDAHSNVGSTFAWVDIGYPRATIHDGRGTIFQRNSGSNQSTLKSRWSPSSILRATCRYSDEPTGERSGRSSAGLYTNLFRQSQESASYQDIASLVYGAHLYARWEVGRGFAGPILLRSTLDCDH